MNWTNRKAAGLMSWKATTLSSCKNRNPKAENGNFQFSGRKMTRERGGRERKRETDLVEKSSRGGGARNLAEDAG